MSGSAQLLLAHGVGRVYELPLPLPAYLGAAVATVLISFVLRALSPRIGRSPWRRIGGPRASETVLTCFRIVATLGLVLTFMFAILEPEPGFTVAPLLFWIGLVVGTTVISSLVAGLWDRGDPWSVLEGLYRIDGGIDDLTSESDPPWWIGPALVYALFWFELVSGKGFDPIVIVIVMLCYTLFLLTFRHRYRSDWRLIDPLSILFGFASRIAPLDLRKDGLYYRGPVAGLDEPEPMPRALFASLFVLLASTTLDNLRETVQWSRFLRVTGLVSVPSVVVDSVALLLLCLPFVLPFLGAVAAARRWTHPSSTLWGEARRFGWSLIPIGIAYVLAHNMPLMISGLPLLINEFAGAFGSEIFVSYAASPKLVWFLEIALIVGGHILGVISAHRMAVRLSGSHSAAVRSTTVLTVLMGFYTVGTLFLLSLAVVVRR